MATGKIEQVTTIERGTFQDQSALWMKFSNGIAVVFGTLTINAGDYANSRYLEGIFTSIYTVQVTPLDADVTAFGKSTNNNMIQYGRRPITNANNLHYLVIGNWK